MIKDSGRWDMNHAEHGRTSVYAGKRVLSIGARRRVLEALSEALRREGFSAVWSDRYADVPYLIREFEASAFDVIAFGRGVSPENRRRLKEVFLGQNPDVNFVEGFAPITNLLVDQIKCAFMPDHVMPVVVRRDSTGGLVVESRERCRLRIKHYRLNWLFQTRESMLADQPIEGGTYRFPVKRSGGRRFIVAEQDDIVTRVMTW
jgi:hypothetical protein